MASPVAQDTLYIPQGAVFEYSWPLTDADTGLAADPTGWQARCEVKTDYGGTVVTRFHTGSSWDGTITFDSDGNMTLHLDDSFTAALAPMANGVFDVELIDPSGNPWRVVEGRAHVTQEVTTDA